MASSLTSSSLSTNTITANEFINSFKFVSVTADSDPYHLPYYGRGVLTFAKVEMTYSVAYPTIYTPDEDGYFLVFTIDTRYNGILDAYKDGLSGLNIKDYSDDNVWKKWSPIYIWNYENKGMILGDSPLYKINGTSWFIYIRT